MKSQIKVLAICWLGILATTNVGWGALGPFQTKINVSANAGVSGLLSKEYDASDPQAMRSSTWAGNWNAKITDGYVPSGAPAKNVGWQTFCMDIGNSMGNGTYVYTAKNFDQGNPPAGNGTGGLPPDPKWVTGGGAKAGSLFRDHLSAMTGAGAGTAAERIARSALAISIWEVLYESSGTYSVSSHSATKGFWVTGSGAPSTGLGTGSEANQAIWLANTWLSASFGNLPSSTWWMEDSTSDAQSLVGSPTAVPEPSTFVAGLLLLVPFLVGAIRRRIRTS